MVVGNYVEIISPGSIYNTYTAMFEKLGFKDPYKNKDLEEKGAKGVIFAIANHLTSKNTKVYAIDLDNGEQILIGERGIKLIKNKIHELW